MGQFVDFQLVKEQVSLADAVSLLSLELKGTNQPNQYRGPCPACNPRGRDLVVTVGKAYYCWAEKKGGDVIGLAAHVLQIPAKDAAKELSERAGLSTTRSASTVPRNRSRERGGEETEKLQPLSYLLHDDEAIATLGLDPKFCEAHGIGYAPKGVCRGSVAIPFRDENGELLGYFGVQDLTYVPPDFTTNVVPLKKRA
jgi:DNA primase